MSAFHNTPCGEKVALAFHALGMTLGSVMLAFDLYVAGWAWIIPHPAKIDFIFEWMMGGALACAVYHLFMLVWHIKATIEHAAYLHNLEKQ